MPGYLEFEFDLPGALLANLTHLFDSMSSAALLPKNLIDIPDAQGVYQLHLRGSLVYIGKTDAEAGLRKRLERHARTIQHRCNLDPNEVSFKAVRVFVFTAMDLEFQLIKHYSAISPVPWNNSGFGSNDPGRRRDHSKVKPNGFDEQYPVDINREIDLCLSSPISAADALAALKKTLPYTFRFETKDDRSRKPHPDLVTTQVNLPAAPYTTRRFLENLTYQLPTGWQATALPSRVLLYKENEDYEFGTIIARS
ncbi:GIY-YIG nuclease family protein [Methylocaldum szegediense]|uniref:Eco29kI restriction endonuclease n=1 Tax=Methylocaldum szegediense TaxID=73780 RepID=A0ABN8XAU6_9GAMM|nr:GIY-YIG nuclease family protein [Methylocaldum szegediense]CAI8982762.1 Eco29kI restriction endonuclease [Methylocaldum szegediense]